MYSSFLWPSSTQENASMCSWFTTVMICALITVMFCQRLDSRDMLADLRTSSNGRKQSSPVSFVYCNWMAYSETYRSSAGGPLKRRSNRTLEKYNTSPPWIFSNRST
uniref:(northern house mosquito) hypothetical protein n=1 Tax=Culex pipiens TaxID=7175 RepID=A0A8D8D327_CULPI